MTDDKPTIPEDAPIARALEAITFDGLRLKLTEDDDVSDDALRSVVHRARKALRAALSGYTISKAPAPAAEGELLPCPFCGFERLRRK